jgi:hypothetical protein
MKHNYNVLSTVNNMVLHFLNFNPKLQLNTLIKNDSPNTNNNNQDKINRKIHWNSEGYILIESNNFFTIILGNETKINKKYNLIDFGYVKIYGITFTDEFINKHKIPSLNSIITFSDNIKHFLKIIKLFDHSDKFKIKINQFGNFNLQDIITQNIPSIILNINEKKNLFDSIDKRYTFYIKVLQTNTTAFIIDKEEKIICYFNSIEKDSSGYIFFYVMALDSKYKIIDYNKKIKNTNDKKNKLKKNNKSTNKHNENKHNENKHNENKHNENKINENKINVIKEDSSISDF